MAILARREGILDSAEVMFGRTEEEVVVVADEELDDDCVAQGGIRGSLLTCNIFHQHHI